MKNNLHEKIDYPWRNENIKKANCNSIACLHYLSKFRDDCMSASVSFTCYSVFLLIHKKVVEILIFSPLEKNWRTFSCKSILQDFINHNASREEFFYKNIKLSTAKKDVTKTIKRTLKWGYVIWPHPRQVYRHFFKNIKRKLYY